jgi:outer membrane receptor protein involved in Fe transport
MMPTVAFTQTAATSNDTSQGAQLEEIIVTAQKRAENVQRVPISVDVASGAELQRAGATTTLDLAVRSPSFSYEMSSTYTKARIRGAGSSANGPGYEQPVGQYIDGIYIADTSTLIDFNNVERVEVLKGPQGTLFGRNATGGVINVVTPDPKHDPSGHFTIGYGNYDTVTGNMYATTGLTKDLAIALAFNGTFQGDGYGTNFATGADVNRMDQFYTARTKLLWTPGETTEVRLSLDYGAAKGSPQAPVQYPNEPSIIGIPKPGDEWDDNSNVTHISHRQSKGAGLRVDQDLGAVTLTSITGYRLTKMDFLLDGDVSPVDGVFYDYKTHDRQLSQEVQLLSSPSSPIQYVIGAYYFDYTNTNPKLNVAEVGPALQPAFGVTAIHTSTKLRTKSYAGFGQATVPLGEQSKLTLGARYTIDKVRFNGTQIAFLPDGTSFSLVPPGAVLPSKQSFKKLTWRAALDHELTDGVLLYASYNRGFKSGSFSAIQPGGAPFKPEILDAYEVGLKSQLFDRRVRLNLAGFYYDYKNLQAAKYVPNGALAVVNAAQARIYGVDVDSEFAVTSNLRLTASVSVLHAEYVDFTGLPVNTFNPGGGNISSIGDGSGNQLPFSAKFVSSLGADYTIPLSSGQFILSGTWMYNNGFFTEPDNLRRQNSFNMINASATWEFNDNYALTIWGKNLANEAILGQATANFLGTFANYQAPRTYGASFKVIF